MNLDELISKYIDAELAPEEDSNLREFISESESARDIYDRSVGIHLAMREDSRAIKPPVDLVRETEAKVMMSIMALKAEPQPAKVHKTYQSRVRFYQFAAAAVVMFLVGVITINDINLINQFGFNELARLTREEDLSMNYYVDENGTMAPLGDGIQTISMPRERFIPAKAMRIEPVSELAPVAYSQSSEIAGNGGSSIPNATAPVQPAIVFDRNELLAGSDYSSATGSANSLERMNNTNFQPIANAMMIRFSPTDYDQANPSINVNGRAKRQSVNAIGSPFGIDLGIVHSIVNVTSHFGTDLVRSGFDNAENSSITHFSQAIAFGLDESNFLGVELGYSQYTCADKIQVRVTTGGGSGRNSTEEKKPTQVEVPNQYQVAPKNVSTNKQMIWCAAFYEFNFLNSGNFSLDTRLGLGASADGPLGYSRIMTRYELIQGLYITLGLEGRLFRANLEEMSSSTPTFKSSASAIYGIQLKF